jgi:hypothetical protein
MQGRRTRSRPSECVEGFTILVDGKRVGRGESIEGNVSNRRGVGFPAEMRERRLREHGVFVV